jgi:hypothetical protein
MSWSSGFGALVLASLSVSCTLPAIATEVCPSRDGALLQSVDVFDGPTEELAMLMPDTANERSGYWQLGYVYDAGRFVTVRCKYVGGQRLDVKLANKVKRCDYKIDSGKRLSLWCK